MATQVSLTSGAVASAGSLSIQSNGTTEAIGISTGQVATLAQNPVLTSGTANGVAYLNGSKVLTTGSALTFDGTNLGIGTSSPAVKFDIGVQGVVGSFGTTANESGVGVRLLGSAAQKTWLISSNLFNGGMFQISRSTAAGGTSYTTPDLSIDSSGNLGLGVTPSAWRSTTKAFEGLAGSVFDFSTTSKGISQNAYLDSVGWKYKISAIASLYEQSDGKHVWYTAPSGTAGNAITFTQAMTLDASGILRVNNTSTPSGNGGFGSEIAYIGNGANGSLFYTTASAGSGTAIEVTRQNDGAGIYFFRNGSAAGYINITTGAISVNNSSDYRLKENITTLSGSLAKIMQVRPVTFDWKENGEPGKSVIAHELQEIFPEAVFGDKDAINEDGSIKAQSVALGNLVPDLIAAMQEQQTIIQQLQAQLTSVSADVAALKGQA